MVGGLVEQQQVGLAQQQLAQRDTAALTTGEVGDRLVRRRAAQRVHRLLELRVDVPRVGVVELLLELAHLLHQLVRVVGRHELGDLVEPVQFDLDLAEALLDVAADRLLLVERRFLQQDADGRFRVEERLAVAGLVQPGHDLEDGRLARAVRSDHTDLGTRVEAHGDVIEDDLVTVRLAHLLHRVDKLRHALQRIGPSVGTHILDFLPVPRRPHGPVPLPGEQLRDERRRVRQRREHRVVVIPPDMSDNAGRRPPAVRSAASFTDKGAGTIVSRRPWPMNSGRS